MNSKSVSHKTQDSTRDSKRSSVASKMTPDKSPNEPDVYGENFYAFETPKKSIVAESQSFTPPSFPNKKNCKFLRNRQPGYNRADILEYILSNN